MLSLTAKQQKRQQHRERRRLPTDKIFAVACNCPGDYGHVGNCPLYHYLLIKNRMCRRMKVINHIDERIVDAIYRLTVRRWRRLGIKRWM